MNSDIIYHSESDHGQTTKVDNELHEHGLRKNTKQKGGGWQSFNLSQEIYKAIK